MKTNKKILIVDRKPKNADLLCKFLQKQEFSCLSAADYSRMDELIDKGTKIDAVIMDVTGFDEKIWNRCKKFTQKNIPFLILSANPHKNIKKEGVKQGAKAVMGKPVIMKEFLEMIDSITANE